DVVDSVHMVDLSHFDLLDVSSGKSSLIELMVFTKNAKFKFGDTNNEHPVTTKPIKTYPHHTVFMMGQCTTILPGHVENPDLFYVNVSSQQYKAVELFTKLRVYSDETLMPPEIYRIFVPQKNQPCVAKFKDNMYYRALITKVHSPEKVSVMFVDFGNEEEKDLSELRRIKDEFLSLPKQAVPCSLADIKPLHSHKWSDNATRALNDLIAGEMPNAGQLLTMTVYSYDDFGKASVVLHRFDGVSTSINVNASLVSQDFAQSTGPLSVTGDIRHKVTCKSEDGLPPVLMESTNLSAYNILKEMTERNESGKVPKKERLVPVVVSHWKNPEQIWVQIATKELLHHLRTVEDYINREMSNPHSFHSKHANLTSEHPLKEGEMCLYKVIVENNVSWRRGRVIEVLRDPDARDPRIVCNTYKVTSYDYGDTLELKRKDIVKLSPNSSFLKNKSYCVQCRIVGIIAAGGSTWTQTALERFKSLLTKHHSDLFILVKELPLPDEQPESIGISLVAKESIIPGPLEPRKETFQPFKNLLINEAVAMPTMRRQRDTQESDDELDLNCANPSPSSSVDNMRTPMPFSMNKETSLLSKLKKEHQMSEIQTIDTKARYLEPDFPINQVFRATITDVDHDLNIHFRIVPDNDAPQPIQIINQAIIQAMRDRETLTPLAGEISIGRACSAYFDFDKTWNRAEIIGIVRDQRSNNNILQVRFVDYGNIDDVYPEQLSSDIFMLEIPKLAIYGKLHGCRPFNNNVMGKLLSELRSLIDKTLTIRWENFLVDKLPMKISIDIPEHGNLKNILMNKDLVVDEVDTDDIPEEAMRVIHRIEKSDYKMNSLTFSLNTYYPIAVSHPVAFNYFFMQALGISNPTTSNEHEIKVQDEYFFDCIRNMRDEVNNFNQVSRRTEGDIVCAQFCDDEWYRCIVTSTTWSGSSTEVIYVDYGNSWNVKNNQMRELPNRFMNCPTHAFLVRLGNIRPSRKETWKPKHSTMIADALAKFGDRPLAAIFSSVDFPMTVDLYETTRNNPRQPIRHALKDLVNTGEFEFITPPFC
ncbi:RING finger protein 17-like protein, partial [Leptotrombidium deliense]